MRPDCGFLFIEMNFINVSLIQGLEKSCRIILLQNNHENVIKCVISFEKCVDSRTI